MTDSGARDNTAGQSGRGVGNTITGVVAGSTVQAGAVYGGIHVHQPAPSSGIVPRQLRPAPARFTGREEELARLERITGADRERNGPALAVISGPGGVGKTALALRWLRNTMDRYPEGQIYADLGAEGTEGPILLSTVLSRFLRALGIPGERIPVDVGEAAALFRTVTADKRIAVLLENAESAAQVRALLPASPASTVVVTTRWRLGGLVMDGAEFVPLAPLGIAAGAELLARAVGDSRISREPDAVTRLVELCGGLPIALSVAGARLVMRPRWPVARVVRDLTDEQQRLTVLSMEQDMSVRGAFDLSYDALPDPVARAYRWLGLHPGPHLDTGLSAAALAATEDEAGDLLETLVDAHLLEVDESDHYRFHDLVRLHARNRAKHEDDETVRAAVCRRIMEYHVHTAAAADLMVIPLGWHLGPAYQHLDVASAPYHDGTGALDHLESELPNLMAALRVAVEYGFDELAWQLCEAMWSLFLYRKHFSEWILAYQLGIDAADRCGDQAAKSRMHRLLGFAFHNLGRYDEAAGQGEAALAAARAARHAMAESDALSLVGMVNRARGRFDEAIDVLRLAVDHDRRAGLPRGEALHRRRLGQALCDAGRLDEAIDELRQARELAAALADDHVESNTMVWLADALSRAGRPGEAVELLRDAWQVLRDSGSRQYRAQVLMVWGEASERLNDVTTARELLTQARDLYAEIGAPHVARAQTVLDDIEARLPTPNARETPPREATRQAHPGSDQR